MINTCTRLVRRLLPATILAVLLSLAAHAAEELKKNYDLPATDAAAALKRFSEVSGRETLFAADVVRGVHTAALRGDFTAQEALDRLLAGTGLVAVQDATGAFAVKRPDPDRDEKNGSSRAVPGSDEIASRTVRLDKYEVTSTRETGVVNQGIIPRAENQAARYVVITREAIGRSGATSLSELLVRQLPQATGMGTDTQQLFSAQMNLLDGITSTGDTINLRGFGSNQTLVLVNGRRLYGSENAGPDISRIPLSAVERVEISPTSGSAIYGANAVGGVINIILRKDYAGRETTLYLGAAHGGAEEMRFNYLEGFTFNEGRTHLMLSAELRKVHSLSLLDRGYEARAVDRVPPSSPEYRNAILANFVGPRAVIFNLIPTGLGVPSDPDNRVAMVPVGSDGIGLTGSDLTEPGGVAFTERFARVTLQGPSESASVLAVIEHALRGDRLSAYSELSYRWEDNSAGEFGDLVFPFLLLPGAPFNSLDLPVVAYVDPIDVPAARQSSRQRTYRAVAGLKGKLTLFGEREYHWSIDGSWERTETNTSTTRYTTLLSLAAVNGLYNPLRDLTHAPLLPADQLDKLRSTVVVTGAPEIAATNWRANGDLFELWGGTAAISLGAEFRNEFQTGTYDYTYGDYINLPEAFGISPSELPDASIHTSRGAFAGYLELVLPLVGEKNRRPFVRSLDLSAAIRYEKYDDFRAAHPPMVALKWEPLRGVGFRAQFSQGFQPPTQFELNSPGSDIGPTSALMYSYTDPARPGLDNYDQLILHSGRGNPNLRPETSNTWDVGVVLAPPQLPGLTLNVAYFRYDKKDVAGGVSLQQDIEAGRFVRGPNLPGDPAGVPGPIVEIDDPIVNIARQFSDGYDFKLDYRLDAKSAGVFRLSGSATWARSFSQQFQPDGAFYDNLADLSYGGSVPTKWRGVGSLGWERGPWGLTWTARYYGKFFLETNDPTPEAPDRYGLDGPYMGSTIEHNVQLTYRVPEAGGRGWRAWLDGTTIAVGALNVLDRDPGYITDPGRLWYNSFSNPRQRFLYLEVRKTF